MNKKPIIGGIILVAIIGVVYAGAQINPDNPENEESPQLQESQEFSMKEIWRARMVGTEVSYSPPHESQSFPSSYVRGDYPLMQVDTYRTVTLEGNVPYQFDFVASGDSPKEIGITVKLLNYYNPGDKTVFSEYFYKEGTLVDTGISEYYTWDYVGNKNFEISDEQCSSTCNHKIIVWRDVFPIKHDSGGAGGTVTISLLQ